MNDKTRDDPQEQTSTTPEPVTGEASMDPAASHDGVPGDQQSSSSALYVGLGIALLLIVAVTSLYLGGRDPLNPDDRFALALEAVRERNAPVVVTQTRILEEKQIPGYEDKLHVLKGYISLYMNDYDTALLELEEAIEHEDATIKAAALALAGELMHKVNELDQAVKLLSSAIQLDPEYQNAHRLLGAIYFDIGLMQDSIGHLSQVAMLAPDDAMPHRFMGLIHKDYEQYRQAIDNYRESLKREPFQPQREEILVELAESQIHLLRYKDALGTLELALSSPKVLGLRADCLRHLDRNDEAEEQLELALKLDETQYDALLLKGILQLESNQLQDARKTLELAVNYYPRDDRCRYKLIEVYRELNETELVAKNLEIYEPLREQRRRFSELNMEAIKQPEDIELRYELGFLANALDKKKLAVSWLRTALSMDPSHEKAAQLLQEILTEANNRP
ncbi:MAG: tetratricopeptide repeat protein [Planctomycetota bacterium]|nr:tetratricopeptide repeat protein [Planctomycetota bacterium]